MARIVVQVAAESSLVQYLQDLTARLSSGTSRFARTVAIWQQSSMFLSLFENVVFSVAAAARTSVLATLVLESEAILQSSYFYRWLTAEPEQDVIVIDLRNTVSVGPFLIVLDDVMEAFVGFRPASRMYRAGVAIRDYVSRWPIRAASIVLLAAVASGFGFEVVVGALDEVGLAVGVALSLLGVAGLRVHSSWDELRELWVVTIIWKILEPPEPTEQTDERRHPDDHSVSASASTYGNREDQSEDNESW